jgi:hypothetical protein
MRYKPLDTSAEYRAAAKLLLSMVADTPFGNQSDLIRKARQYVEMAELLQRLEDLDK